MLSDSSTIWRDDAESIVGTGVGAVCWVSPESVEQTEIQNALICAPISRAEVQLRYLLQLFLEGGCLGWGAVLATVLRDAPAMARTIRAAHAPNQTFDSVINLRDGLLTLTRWSHSEWCVLHKITITSSRKYHECSKKHLFLFQFGLQTIYVRYTESNFFIE